MTSMMGLASAKMSQASLSSISTNQIATKANSIANSDAELVRATAYNDLSAKTRQTVPDTGFQHEVTLGNESDYSSGIKQRTVTILVYKGSEAIPRAEVKLTRYSAESKPSGLPIGTIIAWASAKNPTDGIWLDCNGQSCAGYAELVSILGKSTVPDYRNRFLEGSAAPGTVLEAGLPNISGHTWGPMYKPFARPSGPFTYNLEHSGVGTDWRDEYSAYWIYFDASRCSSVYGKSSTVQPPAVTVRWLIKAA